MSSIPPHILSILRIGYVKLLDIPKVYTNYKCVERQYGKNGIIKSVSSLLTENPSHIIDNIYLGSSINAANYTTLNEFDIKHIINISDNIPNYFPDDIDYKHYTIPDDDSGSVFDVLDDSYEFLNQNADKNIFVHCFAGASRSASLILYYLIKKHNMTIDNAMKFLKEKRDVVNINVRFIDDVRRKTDEQN